MIQEPTPARAPSPSEPRRAVQQLPLDGARVDPGKATSAGSKAELSREAAGVQPSEKLVQTLKERVERCVGIGVPDFVDEMVDEILRRASFDPATTVRPAQRDTQERAGQKRRHAAAGEGDHFRLRSIKAPA